MPPLLHIRNHLSIEAAKESKQVKAAPRPDVNAKVGGGEGGVEGGQETTKSSSAAAESSRRRNNSLEI